MTQVTIWNEFRHERTDPHVAAHYPNGIHATLAQRRTRTGWTIRTATLDEAEQGLPETLLATTDVQVKWENILSLKLAHFHEGEIYPVSHLLISIRQLVFFCLHIPQGLLFVSKSCMLERIFVSLERKGMRNDPSSRTERFTLNWWW